MAVDIGVASNPEMVIDYPKLMCKSIYIAYFESEREGFYLVGKKFGKKVSFISDGDGWRDYNNTLKLSNKQ